MISPDLLKLFVCPESHAPLALADERLVARLRQAIAAGTLKNKLGQTVSAQLDGALTRADGVVAYPIVDNIPLLLADEAIPLAQLGDRG